MGTFVFEAAGLKHPTLPVGYRDRVQVTLPHGTVRKSVTAAFPLLRTAPPGDARLPAVPAPARWRIAMFAQTKSVIKMCKKHILE